ncbi:unnamed protein product [Staurois parvus]|uniref:Secreted protein n=1 Tax=Staurois parvus TaxID=386267 RepID=A0ABN9GIY0_9NEOB|nr:unnamed protein product [Staurois parvus]
MRCLWYLFHIGFLSLGKDIGAPLSPIARGPHELSVHPWGELTIWKLGHCPRARGLVGGPMRCPWYLFHRLF